MKFNKQWNLITILSFTKGMKLPVGSRLYLLYEAAVLYLQNRNTLSNAKHGKKNSSEQRNAVMLYTLFATLKWKMSQNKLQQRQIPCPLVFKSSIL